MPIIANSKCSKSFLLIKMCRSNNQSFVLKRVSEPFFRLSQRLSAECSGNNSLRTHIDYNCEDSILVYPFFRNTLLSFMQRYPDVPFAQRQEILRRVCEAVGELHGKNWMHGGTSKTLLRTISSLTAVSRTTDIKPDNILVNWADGNDGAPVVSDAVLGDFDIACKMQENEPRQLPYAIGNAMWRSPEGQTGRGVTRASDIYSLGLVVLYLNQVQNSRADGHIQYIFTLGGGDLLLLDGYKELAARGISPEQEIITRHFSYFGPVPDALFQHIDSEKWTKALKGASAMAELAVEDQPDLRFACWGKELGDAAQDLISRMTSLVPSTRITADEILQHDWWLESDESASES